MPSITHFATSLDASVHSRNNPNDDERGTTNNDEQRARTR